MYDSLSVESIGVVSGTLSVSSTTVTVKIAVLLQSPALQSEEPEPIANSHSTWVVPLGNTNQ
jgi:hypothetical protein